MKLTPLQSVKERFGDKASLVDALREFISEDFWVDRLSTEKGLEHVSNAKLLRLYDTLTAVKEKFGNRFKLIDAILEAENRLKDSGFRERLERYPVPRLLDLYKSVVRRKRRAERAADATEGPTESAE